MLEKASRCTRNNNIFSIHTFVAHNHHIDCSEKENAFSSQSKN